MIKCLKITHLLTLLTVLTLLMALRANAQNVELGTGFAKYQVVPDGTWYQKGAPHRLQINTRLFEIGLDDKDDIFSFAGFSWHVDYVNLGHARSICYCTTVDADYNHSTHHLLPGSPMAHYSGNGLVQGLKIAIDPYLILGKWRIGYEKGWFFYRPQWTDCVYGWPAPNGQKLNGCNSTPSRHQDVMENGIWVSRGKFTLSFTQLNMPVKTNEYAVPPLWTGAYEFTLYYSF